MASAFNPRRPALKTIVAPLVALAASSTLTLVAPASAQTDLPPGALRVTPDEMRFGPGRVPGHEIAPLIGASNTPGAYVERVRFPANAISQAHSHPEERTYTILSGTWYVGYGDTYDPARLKAWPTSPACRQASAMCRSKRERRGSRGLIDSACRKRSIARSGCPSIRCAMPRYE